MAPIVDRQNLASVHMINIPSCACSVSLPSQMGNLDYRILSIKPIMNHDSKWNCLLIKTNCKSTTWSGQKQHSIKINTQGDKIPKFIFGGGRFTIKAAPTKDSSSVMGKAGDRALGRGPKLFEYSSKLCIEKPANPMLQSHIDKSRFINKQLEMSRWKVRINANI